MNGLINELKTCFSLKLHESLLKLTIIHTSNFDISRLHLEILSRKKEFRFKIWILKIFEKSDICHIRKIDKEVRRIMIEIRIIEL